jgi:hypothetical protein
MLGAALVTTNWNWQVAESGPGMQLPKPSTTCSWTVCGEAPTSEQEVW